MKFVAVIIGNLQVFQIYRLPNRISTAIKVLLAMLPSWIRILVRSIKKSIFIIIIQILLMSILHLDLYSELCTIEVDLSHLWNTSNVQTLLRSSGVYYKVTYELVMLFGGTEIKALVCWKENVRSTIFENCFIVLGLTMLIAFFYIPLGCREEVMVFFFFFSLWLTF